MDGKEIEASIVIPSYNGGEDFKECLRMVFRQKVNLPFEVIVVDSGSTDGTLDFLKGHPIRLKQISHKEFNHGLTRNMGIELARGRYVVLMTQDAIPADGHWLENILENFKDELVAGVYCRQIPKQDADVLTKRHLNNWLTGRQDRDISFIQSWKDYNVLEPMKKLMLCAFDDVCSCIRKSVWGEIPFTATYFAEDLEWGKKVIEAGYKIVYEPRAAVVHSHDRSFLYEYERTYLCHRRLFELFRLQTVPTFKHALKSSILNILKDIPYVIKEEKDWKRKLSLILRIPFSSFSSVFGQYMGARDERLERPHTVSQRQITTVEEESTNSFLEKITSLAIINRLEKIYEQRPDVRVILYILGMPKILEWVHSVGVSSIKELKSLVPAFPPPELTRITAEQELETFLWTGIVDIERIMKLYEENKSTTDPIRPTILDFGCGCGRLSRFFNDHTNYWSVYACDVNSSLVEWCKKNLKGIQTTKNSYSPPLRYKDRMFNLVYSLSVFTHLCEESANQWLSEIHRILAPDGILIITTHGIPALEIIKDSEIHHKMFEIDREGVIDLIKNLEEKLFIFRKYNRDAIARAQAGDDYGNTFIHSDYFYRKLHDDKFQVVEHLPGGLRNWQDVIVLRRK